MRFRCHHKPCTNSQSVLPASAYTNIRTSTKMHAHAQWILVVSALMCGAVVIFPRLSSFNFPRFQKCIFLRRMQIWEDFVQFYSVLRRILCDRGDLVSAGPRTPPPPYRPSVLGVACRGAVAFVFLGCLPNRFNGECRLLPKRAKKHSIAADCGELKATFGFRLEVCCRAAGQTMN